MSPAAAPLVTLVVLDGWGIAPPGPGNAVDLARTPVFDELVARYPSTQLAASGPAVGLPEGQMGNSEVGHLTIGSGRILFQDLVRVLEDMTSDWDSEFSGGITPETRLIADLGFESIDVVQLIVAIEERFQKRDMKFEELLMENGRYVDELRVGQVVDFLAKQLNAA